MAKHGSDAVVIAGAGPVGLVTALRLAQQGVPTRVVERAAGPQGDLRASTFHPPTLEMLDQLSLGAPLRALGLRTDRWQIRLHETHERAEFDLAMIAGDTPYPFRLQAEQRELCRLAGERIVDEPLIDLRWNTEVTGFTQDDTRVHVTLRGPDGEPEVADTPYLIGADGARSRVRDVLGIPFDGLTYPEMTILVTTRFPFEDHLPGLSNVNYVWYDQGTFSLLRLPDLWRVSLYPDDGESEADALAPARLQKKLQRIVARDEPWEILASRPYRIHQRIVDDYRAGRVLLAGDAAHVNSPSGGMGMNGGIHDAFCLADLLAPAWHSNAGPESLDRYTRRRRPIAEAQILKQAHANRTRMQERDPDARRAELRRLQDITADPARAREYLLRSSMIAGLREAEALG